MTNSTSILITGQGIMFASQSPGGYKPVTCGCFSFTDLDKYTGYKLRVAASTAVGESSLSEEDDIFVFTLEDGV